MVVTALAPVLRTFFGRNPGDNDDTGTRSGLVFDSEGRYTKFCARNMHVIKTGSFQKLVNTLFIDGTPAAKDDFHQIATIYRKEIVSIPTTAAAASKVNGYAIFGFRFPSESLRGEGS